MNRFAAIITMITFVACASCDDGEPQGAGVVVALPSPAATGADGESGPHGVSRVTVHANVRVDEAMDIEVTYPSVAGGSLDPRGAPYPAVVFVQGGLVGAERYRWIANHIASRGYVVMMPSHIANLAFFETDNAILALRAVQHAAAGTGTLARAVSRDATHPRAAVIGHSLGGVVAVRQWISHGFDGVALLAAFPAEGDPVTSRAGSPVLSLVGENDTRKSPAAAYVDGFERFASPRLFARIDGMNHYAWTDDASDGDLAGDGPETRPVEAVRRDAMRVLDLWLDANLSNNADAATALAASGFPGVTMVRR